MLALLLVEMLPSQSHGRIASGFEKLVEPRPLFFLGGKHRGDDGGVDAAAHLLLQGELPHLFQQVDGLGEAGIGVCLARRQQVSIDLRRLFRQHLLDRRLGDLRQLLPVGQ